MPMERKRSKHTMMRAITTRGRPHTSTNTRQEMAMNTPKRAMIRTILILGLLLQEHLEIIVNTQTRSRRTPIEGKHPIGVLRPLAANKLSKGNRFRDAPINHTEEALSQMGKIATPAIKNLKQMPDTAVVGHHEGRILDIPPKRATVTLNIMKTISITSNITTKNITAKK